MEIAITILSGLLLSAVTFEIGNRLTGKNKVSEETCKERRENCNNIVCIKIDALHEEIKEMKDSVQNLIKG